MHEPEHELEATGAAALALDRPSVLPTGLHAHAKLDPDARVQGVRLTNRMGGDFGAGVSRLVWGYDCSAW